MYATTPAFYAAPRASSSSYPFSSPPSPHRPLELYPSAARALRSVCLAEAQAVMAARSAMKGDAPGTVAMLHAGKRAQSQHHSQQ